MLRESEVAEGEILIVLLAFDSEPTEAGEEVRPCSYLSHVAGGFEDLFDICFDRAAAVTKQGRGGLRPHDELAQWTQLVPPNSSIESAGWSMVTLVSRHRTRPTQHSKRLQAQKDGSSTCLVRAR